MLVLHICTCCNSVRVSYSIDRPPASKSILFNCKYVYNYRYENNIIGEDLLVSLTGVFLCRLYVRREIEDFTAKCWKGKFMFMFSWHFYRLKIKSLKPHITIPWSCQKYRAEERIIWICAYPLGVFLPFKVAYWYHFIGYSYYLLKAKSNLQLLVSGSFIFRLGANRLWWLRPEHFLIASTKPQSK